MIHAQDSKKVVMIGPVSISNTTITGKVDTLGFDYLTIDVIADSAAATTNVPAVLKLSEADGTTYADIVAFTGGAATSTTVGFVWGTPQTVRHNYCTMHVDLRKRKRYIKATIQMTTAAQIYAVQGTLSRAGELPTTAAEAGTSKLVIG